MAGNNVAFALGLAQKAGKTASGDVAVRAALKSGKVKVLVLAQDAAPNSKKEIYFLAEMAGVQVIELLTRNELGYAIGKGPRIAGLCNRQRTENSCGYYRWEFCQHAVEKIMI